MNLSPLASIVIALATALGGGLIGAWASRRNNKETTQATALQSFLDDVLGRVKDLEAANRQALADIQSLQERNKELWEMWEKEREQKHRLANESHAAQLTYEHAIGDLKEMHARELAEVRAECEKKVQECRVRIIELERELATLKATAADHGPREG